MFRELLIAAGPGEWRAAWLEDGNAVELHVERGDRAAAGSVYLGRVVRRIAGLDAALVEIGSERLGFLPLRRSDPQRLDEGACVVVQVQREAHADKGARLTNRFAGRERFEIAAASAEPPARLHPRPGFAAALSLRLPTPPDRVITDDTALLAELRQTFANAEIVRRPPDDWPITLDAAFDEALAPTVALPGGSSIHIEESRAAVLIDVDTGTPEGGGSAAQTMLAANLAAAQVVARQIRLRHLGGGIIIDFAGIEARGPRDKVREAMTRFLSADPARPEVLGWTRLNHLELVRPRRFRSLGATLLDAPAQRKSAPTLAFEALRLLYREARADPAATWRLTAAPEVVAALRGAAAIALQNLETRLGRSIDLTEATAFDAPLFDIARRSANIGSP